MNKYLANFKLSKNSFKFVRKAQWNNLKRLNLCKKMLSLGNCNLNDESLKIISKCCFTSLRSLGFQSKDIFDVSSELLFEKEWNEF